MRIKKLLITAFTFGLVFMAAATLFAQQNRGGQVGHDLLKTLKPGRWIEIAGIPQPDGSIFIHKINILTGDFQADDWEAKAVVIGIDPKKKEFTVKGGLIIRLNSETEYGNQFGAKPKDFSGFSSIRKGLLIKSEGTFLKDGVLDAEEIKNKVIDPEDSDDKELALVGKIDAIDLNNKKVKMMNITFKILQTTKVKNKFK